MEKRCSYCRNTGHNRGKCSTFDKDIEYIEQVRKAKIQYEIETLEKHLPIGSIVKKTDVMGNEILVIPLSYHNVTNPTIDYYEAERPSYFKYGQQHITIVKRLYKDRKWLSLEKRKHNIAVCLSSITGEKLHNWGRGNEPEYFTFGELKYDILRNRFKIIS